MLAAPPTTGFGDPNENIPDAGVVVADAGLLSAGFAPKLNDGLPDASVPNPTVAGLVGSAGVLEGEGDAARLPKVMGDDSAVVVVAVGLGDPKLKPPLGESFLGASFAGFAPNEKPPEPKVAGLGSSFFSLALLLSVVSAAGFAPKLNPVPDGGVAVVAVVLLLLPNENLGLSSELVGAAAAAVGLLPNENPPELGGGVALEAGTPKENPDLGDSLLSAFLGGTPKLNPELAVVEAAAGLLPNENDGASVGVDPGLACSQQAHLLRVASLRVMQALHSHLPAACCATKLLKPWSEAGAAGIVNIDLMAAGTAEATAAAGAAPGFGLLQQAQLVLSASFLVIQSEHSHRADCWATSALKPASVVFGAAVNGLTGVGAGFAPGLGVSHDTHLVLSGSFRTMHASHSHLFEPVSLNALPKPAAGAAGLGASASRQLPDLSASKQLPLLSGRGAFTGLTLAAAVAAGVTLDLTLAVSGLNWKPVSFAGPLAFPSGSGLLNLKLLSVAGLLGVWGRFSLAGDENLYAAAALESFETAAVAEAGKMVALLDLKVVAELLLLMVLILGWVSLALVAFFHAGSPFLLAPLVAATLLPDDTLISNLGTDLRPASCTSGSTSCGTGLLLSRSAADSSRTRCNLLRILLVCLLELLLLESSGSAAPGSLYSVGSFRIVPALDSVASRRTDSVLVWRRFIWSSWEMLGIWSSLVGGLLVDVELDAEALWGLLYGVRGLDIRMLRLMVRSSSLNRRRACTRPGTLADASVLLRLRLLPSLRASLSGPEHWFMISRIRLAVLDRADVSDARLVLEEEKLESAEAGRIWTGTRKAFWRMSRRAL